MAEFELEDAIEKAEKFFEKRHSTMNLESTRLEDGNWHLVFDVGFLSRQLKEIKINASSGKIVGYASINTDGKEDT